MINFDCSICKEPLLFGPNKLYCTKFYYNKICHDRLYMNFAMEKIIAYTLYKFVNECDYQLVADAISTRLFKRKNNRSSWHQVLKFDFYIPIKNQQDLNSIIDRLIKLIPFS